MAGPAAPSHGSTTRWVLSEAPESALPGLPLGGLLHKARLSNMITPPALTGNPRIDRSLLALARILAEIAAGAVANTPPSYDPATRDITSPARQVRNAGEAKQ